MFASKRVLRVNPKLYVCGDNKLNNFTSCMRLRNANLSKTMSTSASQDVTEKQKFLAVFPEVVADAVKVCKEFANSPMLEPWVKNMMGSLSMGGHTFKGLMSVRAYQMLENPDNITEKSLLMARKLGWCVELYQTAVIIIDDILDNSLTRRGSQCWYLRPEVGLRAINDADTLKYLTLELTHLYCGSKPNYLQLMKHINEANLSYCIGQHLDLMAARKYDLFTLDFYKSISSAKLLNYTFKVPTSCGLLLANKPMNNVYDNMKDILVDMGTLCTMQNDFMDCYGDVDLYGKVGTDIQEGKCTWLSVTALQQCSAAQRKEFESCYGRKEEQYVQRIKQLYQDLRMPEIYHETEQRMYENIVRRLEALPKYNSISSSIMVAMLNKIRDLSAHRSLQIKYST